jgi:hypothetical protein
MVFTLWLLQGFAWVVSGADQWQDIGLGSSITNHFLARLESLVPLDRL